MKILKQIPEIQLRYSFRVKKEDRVQIRSSEDSLNALLQIWDHDTLDYREMFIVLYLNRCNHVLGYRIISIGGVAGTVVDVKQVLAVGVKANASCIVLAHNHPSGQLLPSQQDIDLTAKIKAGGNLLDISVLDHLILTSDDTYFSFADEGYL